MFLTGHVVLKYLNRGKDKAERENLVIKQMDMYLGRIREENDQLRKDLNEEIKKNELCEYEHSVTQLQLFQTMQQVDMQKWKKETVFILDDNETDLIVFRQFFSRVLTIDYRTFLQPEIFLSAAREEKPRVVILDHYLSETMTADEVIKQLGYEPEVFVMSANKDVQIKYKDRKVNFYYKGEFYVLKIAKAVMAYLRDVNLLSIINP